MKNNFFSWLCSLVLLPNLLSAQARFPVSDIPPALLENANIIVRSYELKFEVLNRGEAIETEHRVFTILNERGAESSELTFYYSKLKSIEDISASVFDANGKLIRNLKKKDIQDEKPPEEYVNDSRCKVLSLPASAYPYTIEYTVEKKHKGLMFYPVFWPQSRPTESVEAASFELVMSADLKVRVKEVNLPAGSKKGDLHWVFQNIPAFRTESYAPSARLKMPKILTAPTDFTLVGYDGDMRTWSSYGKFIHTLNATQQEIPAATKAYLQKLVADCPDMECKIERVYSYLQSTTRYFYVGLGIGGWQPAPAADVDHFKYGDCKGLSNYTVAMLQAVGVPARYVLIRATEGDRTSQYPDFPNAWFNHAIACVPLANDTIWLECTSQTESCGFLSTHTDDRPALIVSPEGGQLVQTPRYDERHNLTQRDIHIALALDGSAKVRANNKFQGISQNKVAQIAEQPEAVQKKELYDWLSISDFTIDSLTYERKKGRMPLVNQKWVLTIPKLASVSGKRLFVPIRLLSSQWSIPAADSTRQSDVQATSRGYTSQEEVVLQMPEGYRLEGTLEPVVADSPFGHYELRVREEAGKLLVSRKLVINDSIQPKDQFVVWIEFLKTIAKNDKRKLVLVKPT